MTDGNENREALWRLASSVTNDDELKSHLVSRASSENRVAGPDLSHEALQSNRHIRLLVLLPGTIEDQIQCGLKQVSIDSPDTIYTALSYTWGDPEICLSLHCNGAKALVTVNLYSALLRLRHPHTEQMLWIDALCINQNPKPEALHERATQIKMMGEIFSCAEKVIVDLGGASADTARNLLNFLATDYHTSHRHAPYNQLTHVSTLNAISPPVAHSQWAVVADVLRRPWFRRAWVIQEFILAQHVEMKIGSTAVAISKLEPLQALYIQLDAYFKRTEPNVTSDFLDALYCLTNLLTRRVGRFEERSLVSWLLLSIGSRATYKQDRIYGILGLLTDTDRAKIDVDYFQDDRKLEQTVAKIMIESDSLSDCLRFARGLNKECASWTPPFLGDQRAIWRLQTSGGRLSCYNACGANVSACASVIDQETILTTQAVQIDVIQSTSSPSRCQKLSPTEFEVAGLAIARTTDLHEHIVSWYRCVKAWINDSFSAWEINERHRTFWRTIMWDQASNVSAQAPRFSEDPAEVDSDRVWTETYELSISPPKRDDSRWYSLVRITRFWFLKRLCRTTNGRMASIPQIACHGDEIWIIQGVPVPVVLRRIDKGQHVYLGLCYVHGMMDGQALSLPSRGFETIHIK